MVNIYIMSKKLKGKRTKKKLVYLGNLLMEKKKNYSA